jgi:hypothetical protein
MKRFLNNARALERMRSALPFAGLGFDLSMVVERSRSMRCRYARAWTPPVFRGARPIRREIPPVAGFDLLVRLGRATQGR